MASIEMAASKVYLIDGTYELFRAYYGAPRARSGGREVGAVRGLLRSIASLLREPAAVYLACAFDHVIESFRNDLYPGYKTSEGVEADLLAQFELAEEAMVALGVATWPMIEFEADDAIATAVAHLREDARVEQIVIASPDKDLCQCVRGARVVSWDRVRGRVLDEAGVVQKFGVPPESIPDYLALVGDTADGFPGIPRWGPKSAAAVLARYGHLESIPTDARSWEVSVRGAEALSANLEAAREEALLYRRLATLREDAPIDASLEAVTWQGAHREALAALCRDIGEEGVLERVPRYK